MPAQQPLDHDAFHWHGSHPAADFLNTLEDRYLPGSVELLVSYGALVDFARQARLIEQPLARRLSRTAPAAGARSLASAIGLREAVFSVLAARREHRPPAAPDWRLVETALQEAHQARRFVLKGTEPAFAWRHPEAPARPLWELAFSIEDLLRSEPSRLKKCAATDCGIIFLDRTRGNTRRWCDMDYCGNRAKVRRFRRALKT